MVAKPTPTRNVFGDDPIVDQEQDLLGWGEYAVHVAELIDQASQQTNSAVIALVGPWGSGKTSLLNFVRQHLDDAQSFKVVEFNPWIVADLPSLTADFFRTLIAAMPNKKAKKIRRQLASYANAAAPAAGLVNIPGINVGQAVEMSRKKLAGDQSIEGQRREIERQLKKARHRVLIVLDDIDRLHPEELLLVFKLVRLVGRLPNVYYLLAYDEKTLLDVITQTGLARDKPDRARDYLEKMTQLRVEVPPINAISASRLFYNILEEIAIRHNAVRDPADIYRLGSAYRIHLSSYLHEPRQIKKFCAQIEAQYPLLKSEVNFVDFGIITFLRVFQPAVISLLRGHKMELTGMELDLDQGASHEERVKNWRERLETIGVAKDELDNLLAVLAELFLPIKSAIEGSGHGGTIAEQSEAKRVGSFEYFDRYFHLIVGPGDLSDSTVNDAIDEVLRDSPSEAWIQLAQTVPTNAELVVDKLRRFIPDDALAAEKLLPFLCGLEKLVPPNSGFMGRGNAVLPLLAGDLLIKSTPRSSQEFAASLEQACGIRFLAEATIDGKNSLTRDETPAPTSFREIINRVTILLAQELEEQATLPLIETAGVLELLTCWGELDPTAPRDEWVLRHLDSNIWSAADFVALFVPVNTVLTGGLGTPMLGDPDLKSLDELVDRDNLVERIGDPKTDPIYSEYKAARSDITFRARRSRALASIAHSYSRYGRDDSQPD